MFETLSLFSLLFEYLNQILRGEAPLLVYFLLLLIPIAILVAIRESFSWFFKVNKITQRLDRLDKRLMVLNGSIEEIVMILKHQIQKSKIHAGSDSAHMRNRSDHQSPVREKNSPDGKSGEISQKENEEFTLQERPWSEK